METQKRCHTFMLTGRSNVLEFALPRPLELFGPCEIGLTGFVTYYSIPNIDITNRLLFYSESRDENYSGISFPIGAYEIEGIEEYLQEQLGGAEAIKLKANNGTLKVSMKSKYWIDFRRPGTLRKVLGFGKRLLAPDEWHEADYRVNISPVNMICIECSIADGGYVNGVHGHHIYAFAPDIEPGFKMVEQPSTIHYYPVLGDKIQRLLVNIVDQQGRAINFGGEEVTVRLHVRPLTYG